MQKYMAEGPGSSAYNTITHRAIAPAFRDLQVPKNRKGGMEASATSLRGSKARSGQRREIFQRTAGGLFTIKDHKDQSGNIDDSQLLLVHGFDLQGAASLTVTESPGSRSPALREAKPAVESKQLSVSMIKPTINQGLVK